MQGPPSVAKKLQVFPHGAQPRCGAVRTLKTAAAAGRSWPTGRPRPVRCEHAVVIAEPVVVGEARGRRRSSGLAAGRGSGTGRAGTAPYPVRGAGALRHPGRPGRCCRCAHQRPQCIRPELRVGSVAVGREVHVACRLGVRVRPVLASGGLRCTGQARAAAAVNRILRMCVPSWREVGGDTGLAFLRGCAK